MNKVQAFGLAFLLLALVLIAAYAVFASLDAVTSFFTSSTTPGIVKAAVVIGAVGLIIMMIALAFESKEVEK